MGKKKKKAQSGGSGSGDDEPDEIELNPSSSDAFRFGSRIELQKRIRRSCAVPKVVAGLVTEYAFAMFDSKIASKRQQAVVSEYYHRIITVPLSLIPSSATAVPSTAGAPVVVDPTAPVIRQYSLTGKSGNPYPQLPPTEANIRSISRLNAPINTSGWVLLLRVVRHDGFQAIKGSDVLNRFNSLCTGIGETITFVQFEDGCVAAGYSPVSWIRPLHVTGRHLPVERYIDATEWSVDFLTAEAATASASPAPGKEQSAFLFRQRTERHRTAVAGFGITPAANATDRLSVPWNTSRGAYARGLAFTGVDGFEIDLLDWATVSTYYRERQAITAIEVFGRTKPEHSIPIPPPPRPPGGGGLFPPAAAPVRPAAATRVNPPPNTARRGGRAKK